MRFTAMHGNRLVLTLLTLFLLGCSAFIVARFADDRTKARIYGWLPGGAAPVEQGSDRRPQ